MPHQCITAHHSNHCSSKQAPSLPENMHQLAQGKNPLQSVVPAPNTRLACCHHHDKNSKMKEIVAIIDNNIKALTLTTLGAGM